ncbi:Exopolyphosphatase [Anaerovibrio sp. JC8]|uniref:Ppx/GppA phosphatase family protein n=1 Tax=Anaerovibrio sp. JC8 TaxID=1240085 RepID=UPI000A0A73AC|nr:exopolyphosphatase [Anaerovibrio sp. JC8]ORU01131.1 Exopolyphosphatase [Anaerovibrio sp. JC8]
MIQAIIDIGSNTVRMAIYEIEGGSMEQILKKKHMVGLAGYLKDNIMSQEGVDRVVEVLNEYREFLQVFGINNVMAFTTAALRNCANSTEVVAEIIQRTGIQIRVISGEEEAEYDFVGATRNIQSSDGMLVDIGGGSTELVYYENHKIKHKISLPLGSLGLKKECCTSMLPNSGEVAKMYEVAKKAIEGATDFENIRAKVICGIGGTYKGTTALYNALYNQSKSNKELDVSRFPEIISRFGSTGKLSQSESIILMKNIPDRIHTIISGLVIADIIATKFGAEKVIYSDSGVREGFLYAEIIGK